MWWCCVDVPASLVNLSTLLVQGVVGRQGRVSTGYGQVGWVEESVPSRPSSPAFDPRRGGGGQAGRGMRERS
jgi:hypothetical protein